MPRSESEIQTEIDALKAQGVHPASKQLRALRDEIKALSAPPPAPASAPPSDAPRGTTTSDAASAIAVPPVMAEAGEWVFPKPPPKSRWCSEEEFIDRTLTEIAAGLDFRGGSMGNVVEKLYERLDAVVKTRRIIVEVLDQIGPGERWPQFIALERNGSTGERKARISHTPFPGTQTPKAPAPEVPPVTDGGMPIRQSHPTRDEILQAVTGGDPRAGILREVEARPEPVRAPQPASA